MKKFTTLVMAATISVVTMLASGNAFATNSKPGMQNADHQKSMNKHKKSNKKQGQNNNRKQVVKNNHKKDHRMGGKPNGHHKGNRHQTKNKKDVPAPIPGLLALAAAAGGGAMLRRKAKKSQPEK